jgi:hypothetical protein
MGTGSSNEYFWVWYWIYHITFICDLGLHVERPAVDICPCWRLLAGCFPFADWILLFCLIVVSWTFVPHRSIFLFHKYKVRQEISFQNGRFPFLRSKTTVIFSNKGVLICHLWPVFHTINHGAHDSPLQLFNWIPILKLQFNFIKLHFSLLNFTFFKNEVWETFCFCTIIFLSKLLMMNYKS